ncbi:MoxR family ATPase [Actinophytocola sp.]|uniref:ATP-binding protein n=1 Tax=Actinophytocola sp. TaxID=1872138 RepID=UPI002D7FF7B8|nr:MoxR family ATPase [Actinophytocola sp.]HET9140029.1 MoxR family ATPase [Actinophytocola sp.]
MTPAQLPEVLLRVAVVRPVHIWGPPGIGKSTLVGDFAAEVGLDCVSLLGTQLAPEDISGVPQIVLGADGVARSRFAPPEMIARTDPFVLFLDELNGSSAEVQKAFYQIVLDRRIGAYELPRSTIVIAAGNRATDQAVVRPMSSALANRFVHLHLAANARDWLAWAGPAGIHPWVYDYLGNRPDQLWVAPPKTEEPFSTPRSWHALSDALHSWGPDVSEDQVRMLAHGCVSPAHAASFAAFVRTRLHAYDLEPILKGDAGWPTAAGDRDILYFLAMSLRARLIKELPAERRGAPASAVRLAHRGKDLITSLAELSLEYAQLVVAGDDEGNALLPTWFLTEVVRDLPRLVAARSA